jgi:hypothetical protein
MRYAGLFRTWVVGVTCVLTAAPRVGVGDDRLRTPQGYSLVRDVALGDAADLRGRLMDADLRPQPHKKVSLWRENRGLAEAATDAEGRFSFAPLRGGVYSLRSDDGLQSYRVWAPGTAPPHAEQEAIVVAATPIIRGQRPHPIYGILRDPLLLATIVAAAIAIPIVIAAADDDDDAS